MTSNHVDTDTHRGCARATEMMSARTATAAYRVEAARKVSM